MNPQRCQQIKRNVYFSWKETDASMQNPRQIQKLQGGAAKVNWSGINKLREAETCSSVRSSRRMGRCLQVSKSRWSDSGLMYSNKLSRCLNLTFWPGCDDHWHRGHLRTACEKYISSPHDKRRRCGQSRRKEKLSILVPYTISLRINIMIFPLNY